MLDAVASLEASQKIIREHLGDMLPHVKAGHIAEATAAAYGFNTHASFLAHLRATRAHSLATFKPDLFKDRLATFGVTITGGQFETVAVFAADLARKRLFPRTPPAFRIGGEMLEGAPRYRPMLAYDHLSQLDHIARSGHFPAALVTDDSGRPIGEPTLSQDLKYRRRGAELVPAPGRRAEFLALHAARELRKGQPPLRLYSTHPPDTEVLSACSSANVQAVVYPEYYAHGPARMGPTDAARHVAEERGIALHPSNVLHLGGLDLKIIHDPDVCASPPSEEDLLPAADLDFEPGFITKPWRERTARDDTDIILAELARISSQYGPPGLHPVAALVGPRGERIVGRPAGLLRLRPSGDGRLRPEPAVSPWAAALAELRGLAGRKTVRLGGWIGFGTHSPDPESAEALINQGLRDFRVAIGVGLGNLGGDNEDRHAIGDMLRKKRGSFLSAVHIIGIGGECELTEAGGLQYRPKVLSSAEKWIRDPVEWDIHADPATRPVWA
jgi:hypothetical protein